MLSVTNANDVAITSASHIGNLNPLRYRGYYYDSQTGFYYLQSRYYDPTMHRFINADSYQSTGQGVTGTNMFAYCNNNPTIYSDDSGHLSYLAGQFDTQASLWGAGGSKGFPELEENFLTNDRVEIVKFLLDEGYCDVNDTSVGITALMFAARDSTPEMVKLLLDYGADKSIKSTDNGKTAYDYAAQSNNKDIMALLEN